jgi:tRNA threonylcarbamoyladenosine biosynthesis protein TsaE
VGRLLGAAIGAVAGPDAPVVAIGLRGPLGAGKTEWVKGLAAGLGIDPRQVASPSFVIASEYRGGGRRLAHVDLYRVESEGELESAGFLDLLAPGAVVAVEWADRLPHALPRDRIEVSIRRRGGGAAGEREIEASGTGALGRRLVAEWAARLARPRADAARV